VRIVAGDWRGRTLVAPPGQGTRPTADRVRQALFDMLVHAEWGGRGLIEGAVVLDVFAGTGALGLEALSRGAASACFIEQDATALKALRANVAACKAGDRAVVLAGDVFTMSLGSSPTSADRRQVSPADGLQDQLRQGRTLPSVRPTRVSDPASLVFLDPPYGQDFVPRALARLHDTGRIGPHTLIVAETARDETWLPEQALLAERSYGAARILVFRFIKLK
jgi:16S rRNA (guanine966-N2)-methyltransferase